jgi:transcriptional regulator with XRE-family HTH domain
MLTVSRHLAHNVVALRRARGLTQAQLARMASLPRSTIAYVESGGGNPSLHTLTALTGALQVGVDELLARPRPECVRIPAADLPVERRRDSCRILKLLPDRIPGMQIDRLELDPGGHLVGVPHPDRTREYLTCIEGEVMVDVAGRPYRLETGDVLAFPGDQPHAYRNPGSERSVCISVVALASAI